MSKWDDYAASLNLSDVLRTPLMRSVINFLELPPGSRGLDIGCGTGSNTLMLAEAVGPSGHITGLDLSEDLLTHARSRADRTPLAQQILFQEGDMNALPFEDDSFDWAWSVDCAGYAPGNPFHLIKEIARVVRPGGSIAILAWSSQQLLPGYPQLEAHLNATSIGIAPFVQGRQPELHFLKGPGWFRAAHLKAIQAHTFTGTIQSPLNHEERRALISLFGMRWGTPKSELTEDDWTAYQRLCQPDSPDFIADRPDYYGFFTYSLFHGRVGE